MIIRIRKLRLACDLSQEEFGQILGVTKSTISNIENGRFNITETMIKLACNEFNVNEDWLRHGTGGDESMFLRDQKRIRIENGIKTSDEFRSFLIHMMESLPDDYCEFLYGEFKRFSEKHEKKKKFIEREVEEYRRELEARMSESGSDD